MLKGKATATDTREFLDQFEKIDTRILGQTELSVSSLGFGSYRVDVGIEAHREALKKAIGVGINLIDTSSNYSDGGSEELIGEVLDDLVHDGQLKRSNIVVVTKAGYLQGQNYELSQSRKSKSIPFPELVEIDLGLEHCIHPNFLEIQIEKSRQRLGIECIDIFLLHNPEYFLNDAQGRGDEKEAARQEYYRRIELAFNYLEKEVKQGRIQFYGISSNTFPAMDEEFAFTSLAEVLKIADGITNNHFRVIEMPMNLYENSASTLLNQDYQQKSVLELAAERNIAVLINRPLNAIVGGKLHRLAQSPKSMHATKSEVIEAVNKLREFEQRIKQNVLKDSGLPSEVSQAVLQVTEIGTLLTENWQQVKDVEQWTMIIYQNIAPVVRRNMPFLAKYRENILGSEDFFEHYIELLNQALDEITAYLISERDRDAESLKACLKKNALFDDSLSLSQIAVRAVRESHGVHCVLVGMRRSAYVEDLQDELKALHQAKLDRTAWQQIDNNLPV